MEPFILSAIIIFGLIIAGLTIVLAATLRSARTVQAAETAGKRPQGYWMGIGVAVGMLIGYVSALTTGILMDDMKSFIIFGPATGMLFGVAIGAALEQRHKDELRPLTATEQQARRRAALAGGVLVFLGLLTLIGMALLVGR